MDMVFCADAVLKELPRFFLRVETGVQKRLYLCADAFRTEHGLHPVIRFRAERHYLLFPVNDYSQGDALNAACRQFGLDFLPKDGGKLESHEAVHHAARLLGVHQVHINAPGGLDRIQDRSFGNLVEHYPAGLGGVQLQGFAKVPGYGLSLAVLIGGQPHGAGGIGHFLEFVNKFLLLRGNHIFRLETVVDVHAQLTLLQIPDVAQTGPHSEFVAQIFLYGPHFSGGLDDYKIFTLHSQIFLQSKPHFGDISKFCC